MEVHVTSLNKNSFKGALYGFAIGDAMGATTEFMDKEEIKAKYGKITNISGGGWLNLKKGNVTDDTEMMLCVAKAYVKYQYQLDDFLDECCRNFILWLKSNPVDVGAACLSAIRQNQDNKSYLYWMQNSKNIEINGIPALHHLGNGSLMRCLVPALIEPTGSTDNSCIYQKTVMQGRLTHNNAKCDDCLTVYQEALANPDIIKNYVEKVDLEKSSPCEPTGHVDNTLECTIRNFGVTSSFENAIIKAVNEGGDADTIAALTGGLAGKYYGFEAIPERWVNQLNPKVKNELDSIVKGLGF